MIAVIGIHIGSVDIKVVETLPGPTETFLRRISTTHALPAITPIAPLNHAGGPTYL